MVDKWIRLKAIYDIFSYLILVEQRNCISIVHDNATFVRCPNNMSYRGIARSYQTCIHVFVFLELFYLVAGSRR